MPSLHNRLVLTLLFLAITGLLQGCLSLDRIFFPPPYYEEVLVEEGKREKILILDVDGVITSGIASPSPLVRTPDSMVASLGEKLDHASKDRRIKAVILRIDSPGGSVTASDVCYRMIAEFKEETGLPIYVSMLDVAASGGYYLAVAGDEIYAHPTTITGSIGVMAILPQFEDLGRMIGVYAEVLESGEHKLMTGGFRNMTPEQREIFQTVIDELYDRFIETIMRHRPHLEEPHLRQVADGRIYTANQAVEKGLVDGVMYLDDLITHVRDKHDLHDARVVLYRKTHYPRIHTPYARFQPALIEANGAQATQVNIGLINSLVDPTWNNGAVFHYLWVP